MVLRMASDLQRRKVAVVFGAMDANADGYLTESDFRALTKRWVSLRGGDEELLSGVMMGWWATLSAIAGKDAWLARAGRCDYLLIESSGLSDPIPCP